MKKPSIPVPWPFDQMPMQPVKRTRDGRTESSSVSDLPPNGFGVVEPQEVTPCVAPIDPGVAETPAGDF